MPYWRQRRSVGTPGTEGAGPAFGMDQAAIRKRKARGATPDHLARRQQSSREEERGWERTRRKSLFMGERGTTATTYLPRFPLVGE